MELIPALDLLGGNSVRLYKGSYQEVTTYADPMASVAEFIDAGARWIHLVDLDAARNSGENNRALIGALVASGQANFQVGGGIRSFDDAAAIVDLGVARIVVGTRAVSDIGFFAELAMGYPGMVAAGLDYRRNGSQRICAINGWVQDSEVELGQALARVIAVGAGAAVLTDISKDGTLDGPDLATYAELAPVCGKGGVELLASGGVSSLADLKALARIAREFPALSGVISGKAIQERRFGLAEGVELCRRYG